MKKIKEKRLESGYSDLGRYWECLPLLLSTDMLLYLPSYHITGTCENVKPSLYIALQFASGYGYRRPGKHLLSSGSWGEGCSLVEAGLGGPFDLSS